MDTRLLEASRTGDVQLLHQLLAEIPLLLHSVALVSAENPLHIASIAGHAEFVKDILSFRPDFAKELNHDGFSPMHIASANGYLEIVRELLKVGPSLCQLKGKDEWTPLHYAACRGRVDVIREMLLACPESVEDVTLQGETCFHLAVKNSQFEAVKVLMELIAESRMVNVMNLKDKIGNSVLHLATWKKQHQVVEWLVGINGLEVNSINQSGLTALDLLLILPSEAGDREIYSTLCVAGALRAQQTSHSHSQSLLNNTMTSETHPLQHPKDLIEYFKFKKGRDSPSDARTALLVIAVLVATATFQVGLSPPNGLWQDSTDLSNNTTSNSTEPVRSAGKSIMGAVTFIFFVTFNSIGFSISLYMINVLTSKFPLQLELQICIISMFCTYSFAMSCIAPANAGVYTIVLTSVLPTLVPAAANFARSHIWRYKTLVDWIRRFI